MISIDEDALQSVTRFTHFRLFFWHCLLAILHSSLNCAMPSQLRGI